MRPLRRRLIQLFRTKLVQEKVQILPENPPDCSSYRFRTKSVSIFIGTMETYNTRPYHNVKGNSLRLLPLCTTSIPRSINKLHADNGGSENTSYTSESKANMTNGYFGPFQSSSSESIPSSQTPSTRNHSESLNTTSYPNISLHHSHVTR